MAKVKETSGEAPKQTSRETVVTAPASSAPKALIERLVGHREAIDGLFAALRVERLASTLLFAGPSGVGKKLAALTLAQALVCEKSEIPGCGICGPCLRISSGQSESLCVVEPDGVSIKTEQAREVLEFLTLRQLGRARVIIIDQAHLLNPQAGNSLLKSLEEPPAGTYFILLTPIPAALLSTIRSRSQLVRFKPLSETEITRILGPEADPWVVQASQGSLERAQRLNEKREDFEKIEAVANDYMRQAARGLPSHQITEMRELTKDKLLQVFIAGHIQRVLLDGLRLQAGLSPSETSKVSEDVTTLINQIAQFHPKALQILADLSIEIEQDMMRNVDRGLVFENFAIQWRAAASMPVSPIATDLKG